MSTVISDKNVVRFYAAAWITAYLVVYFFLKSYLPDEYFRDALLIQKLAVGGGEEEWGGAYAIAAFMARILPAPVIIGLVAAVGSFTIWMIVTSLRTVSGMLMIIPALAPFLVLNVMDFGKESFVIPLTYLILWSTTKARSTPYAFVSICAIYLLYGIFFREYYLIILAVFVGCCIIRRAPPPLRLLYILLTVLALFVIPSKMFMDLQGDRDQINYVAEMIFPVHTAILNPVPPNSAFHFIVNYFYVIAKLTLPFLFRQTANEFVLFANVLIYGRLIYFGLKNRAKGPMTFLPLLFIAHILVLFIFEPDAGSYFRHASSVILYLLPSLRLIEQRRADAIHDEPRA